MAYLTNRNAPVSGLANLLAMRGRQGDTELVHMSKPEIDMMERMGKMTSNPVTGLPEAFSFIEKNLKNEEIKFSETLSNGLQLLNKEINAIQDNEFSPEIAFKLYDQLILLLSPFYPFYHKCWCPSSDQ